ncbi:hypothetical protein AYO37_01280, partial [Opitutia bacterium SCGC AG-212-L18]
MKTEKRESVIKECEKLSFEVKGSFPEAVKKLGEVGVESYYVDLVRLEKTCYCEDGETYRDSLPLKDAKGVNSAFLEESVRSAIKGSQRMEIDYASFLHKIMEAGAMGYMVFIKGRQAQYFGRKGERWVECFPSG